MVGALCFVGHEPRQVTTLGNVQVEQMREYRYNARSQVISKQCNVSKIYFVKE